MVRRTRIQRQRKTRPRRSLGNMLKPRRIRTSPDPKSITYNPWNNLTIQRFVTIEKDKQGLPNMIDISYIDAAIRTQIGLQPNTSTAKASDQICFKIRSITLHNLSGLPIGLQLFEPVTDDREDKDNVGVGSPILSVSDYPGKNRFASVTGAYPAWVQQNVYGWWGNNIKIGKQDIAAIITNGAYKSTNDINLLLTIRLAWQPVPVNDSIGNSIPDTIVNNKLTTNSMESSSTTMLVDDGNDNNAIIV